MLNYSQNLIRQNSRWIYSPTMDKTKKILLILRQLRLNPKSLKTT
jgi:hypothetical protein